MGFEEDTEAQRHNGMEGGGFDEILEARKDIPGRFLLCGPSSYAPWRLRALFGYVPSCLPLPVGV